MPDGAILVASKAVMFDWEGQKVYLRPGVTTAREGHPILKDHGDLFEPLVPTFEVDAQPEPASRPQPRASQPATKPPVATGAPAGRGQGKAKSG